MLAVLGDSSPIIPTGPNVTIYPAGASVAQSVDYTVTVEGSPCPVYIATANVGRRFGNDAKTFPVFEDQSFIKFDTDGPTELIVTITDSRVVTSARVLPSRHGVIVEVLNTKHVKITIPYPWAAYELQLNPAANLPDNGHEERPLWIFALPPQDIIPAPGPNVTVWSRSIAGGVHTAGEINVVSNHTYYIEGGAEVDVRFRATTGQTGWEVRGRGTIRRPQNVFWCPEGAGNWSVEGITICRDGRIVAGDWTFKPSRNDTIRVTNTQIFTNTITMDGVDLTHCRNVKLIGVFNQTMDDPCCINGYDGYSNGGRAAPINQIHDIEIRDCVFAPSTGVGALEVGGSMECNDCSLLRYTNIDIIHAYIGCVLSLNDQDCADINDVIYDGIHVEDYRGNLGSNEVWLFRLNVKKSGFSNKTIYIPGKIRNVTYTNIFFTGDLPSFKRSEFNGESATNMVGGPGTDGIRFINCWYYGTKITGPGVIGATSNSFVTNVTYA